MRPIALVLLIALAACSGGGGSASTPASGSSPSAAAALGTPVATSFVFGHVNPAPASTSKRRPAYVTTAVQSVGIALLRVNGTTVTGNLAATVVTNVNLTTCPCTVSGPASPPGNDTFVLSTYDGTAATGNVVSTATPTLAIVANTANSNTITLNGVPASFTITPPGGTAGTAFSATAMSVTVKDADGNTIMGAYSNPVALSDGDTSGATTLATSGSDSPPAGQLLSSSDSTTLAYSGLAIAPAAIGATASGATAGSANFTPTLQPLTTGAPLNGVTPQLTLSTYGTTAQFTPAEVGWTNAPYNKPVTVLTSGDCASVGSVAPAAGTTFTATAAATPSNGTCTVSVRDFSGGSVVSATLAYVSGSQTFTDENDTLAATQSFTLPFGVTMIQISAAGAQGGCTTTNGGTGNIVVATVPVTGLDLTISAGQHGEDGAFDDWPNGGMSGTIDACAGGGASMVQTASGAYLVIAAGGGGAGDSTAATDAKGGGGAYPAGVPGEGPDPGQGGSQTGGGAGGGNGTGSTSMIGGIGGIGGTGLPVKPAGGGGGGGYFGGGGGGGGTGTFGGGGGGSSYYIAGATNVSTTGANFADGSVTINW